MAAAKTILTGTGLDGGRFEGIVLYPEDVIVVGRDPGTKAGDQWYDPRAMWSPKPEMVQSMKAVAEVQTLRAGNLQPIVVVKDDNKFYCAFGRQRTINGRQGNVELESEGRPKMMLRCTVVMKGTDLADIEAMGFAENMARQEEEALDLAEKLFAFIQRHGEDRLPKALEITGLSGERARELLSLRGASAETKAVYKEKKMGVEAAIAFSQLPVNEQSEAIAEAQAITARAGQAKVSKGLALQVVRTRQGKSVALSTSQWRMLWRHFDENGWPENPNGVALVGVFLGENSVDDVPGLKKHLAMAQKAEIKTKEKKSKTAAKKAATKKDGK